MDDKIYVDQFHAFDREMSIINEITRHKDSSITRFRKFYTQKGPGKIWTTKLDVDVSPVENASSKIKEIFCQRVGCTVNDPTPLTIKTSEVEGMPDPLRWTRTAPLKL